MRREYGKLIRDRIPEIIEAAGKRHKVRILDEAAYQEALAAKLIEEGQEVVAAVSSGTRQQQIEELADVYEVLDALLAVTGIASEEVAAVQAARRKERGGFAERLWLLWAEADEG
jgi:predicted house-cleaning noncanonical NTP pyrophosphatase (MazG superfamily)